MKRNEKEICVGLVGSGYGAVLHAGGYENIGNIPLSLKTVCGRNREKARKFQEQYHFKGVCDDYEELLRDPEIDVIDLTTPPLLHIPFAIRAIKAGKHVICEKPLTGFFGRNGEDNIGKTVPKSEMLAAVLAEMDELKDVLENTDRKFMYAENFIFATPVQKAAEILRKRKSKILFMSGEETIIGSSSPVAGHWNQIGGGTLMRNGVHPLTGMLWLKQVEAKARGEEIAIKSVMADCGVQTACLKPDEHNYVKAHPVDVEDVAIVTVTFTDGTKCATICSDATLGGSRNYINIYGHDTTLMCNITPTDIMNTYFMDEKGLDDVYVSELLTAKTGWNKAFVSDEVIRGYAGELHSFMESIAYDTEPVSGFAIAYMATKVMYMAYQSAEEGRRIDF